MGSKTFLLAAAFVTATGFAATGTAQADIYSVVTPFSLTGFENDSPNFRLQRFDPALGALEAMTINFTGAVGSIYFRTGLPPDTPFVVGYHNYILIHGSGFSLITPSLNYVT